MTYFILIYVKFNYILLTLLSCQNNKFDTEYQVKCIIFMYPCV